MSESNNPLTQSRKPKKRRAAERWLRGPDLREAALIAFSLAVTSVNSPPLWAATAQRLASLGNSPQRRRYRRFVERVRAFYGDHVGEAAERKLWLEIHAALNRRRFLTVAEWAGRSFHPMMDVEGADLVHDALRAGRGAILWFDNFLNHQVIGKKALHSAGLGGWQVSYAAHGFSHSCLGKRYLNPVQIGAEAPYVDGRVEFDAASAVTATRQITRLLAANNIVRITNNAYIGRKTVKAPIGPGVAVEIATTPLNLSLKLGTPIFPVSAIELVPLEQYRVVVAPALGVGDQDFAAVAARYGAYLRPLVVAHPGQWRGWAGSISAAQPDP